MDYYLLDETNTSFTPRTCTEAILLWNRIRKAGINDWDDVPRIFQQCACELPAEEHDKFAQFLCNPQGVEAGVIEPEQDYFPQMVCSHPDTKSNSDWSAVDDEKDSSESTDQCDPLPTDQDTVSPGLSDPPSQECSTAKPCDSCNETSCNAL